MGKSDLLKVGIEGDLCYLFSPHGSLGCAW